MGECKFCGVPDVKSTTHYDNPCPEFVVQLRRIAAVAKEADAEWPPNYFDAMAATEADVRLRNELKGLYRDCANSENRPAMPSEGK